MPLVSRDGSGSFEPTRVEVGYLDGIERLDNPTPVTLMIDSDGIEVSELMPGSRTARISAASIIEARVVDASVMVKGQGKRGGWLRLALKPFGGSSRTEEEPEVKKHDYILSIKYRQGENIRHAVFHREDRGGLDAVERLARIIEMLVRLKSDGESDSNRDIQGMQDFQKPGI